MNPLLLLLLPFLMRQFGGGGGNGRGLFANLLNPGGDSREANLPPREVPTERPDVPTRSPLDGNQFARRAPDSPARFVPGGQPPTSSPRSPLIPPTLAGGPTYNKPPFNFGGALQPYQGNPAYPGGSPYPNGSAYPPGGYPGFTPGSGFHFGNRGGDDNGGGGFGFNFGNLFGNGGGFNFGGGFGDNFNMHRFAGEHPFIRNFYRGAQERRWERQPGLDKSNGDYNNVPTTPVAGPPSIFF